MPSPADSSLVTDDVEHALARLRAGGLVAVPTETVYGLAADAEQPDAVRRIFEIKGRPATHPLIVHLSGLDAIDGWVANLDDAIVRLGTASWPGPLTMLVHRGPRVDDVVTGGRDTVGLRVPAHPLTQELLVCHSGGLAAPSANRFGKVSPTTARHVLADLGHLLDPRRDAILDGGPCPVGVESTIVDLTTTPAEVLRAGAIDADDIARILAAPVAAASGPNRASGMLAAHYAPDCEVVLADTRADAEARARQIARRGAAVELLDRTADLVDAARELYADLRRADEHGLDALVVVVPPPTGLGHAIRDRLFKAAAGSSRDPSRRARSSRDG